MDENIIKRLLIVCVVLERRSCLQSELQRFSRSATFFSTLVCSCNASSYSYLRL